MTSGSRTWLPPQRRLNWPWPPNLSVNGLPLSSDFVQRWRNPRTAESLICWLLYRISQTSRLAVIVKKSPGATGLSYGGYSPREEPRCYEHPDLFDIAAQLPHRADRRKRALALAIPLPRCGSAAAHAERWATASWLPIAAVIRDIID